MSNDLAVQDEPLLITMWSEPESLKKIRQMFAPKLTADEFEMYVQMGKSVQLNPFMREIWCIKFDGNAPAQIFVGRDGYRKIISRNPNYEGHIVDAVYSNDEFNVDIVQGSVKHVPNFKDRGKLIGAFAMVYMKNSRIPHYVFAELSEYNTGRSVWKEKPATMIKKVAEAQAIRMADQTCSGTYSEEEMPNDRIADHSPKAEQLNKELHVYEGEQVDQVTGEIMQPESPKREEVKISIPNENAPVFTYDDIKLKMETAKSSDELHEAAAVISSMDISKEQHAELSKIYRDRVKEVKKLEG